MPPLTTGAHDIEQPVEQAPHVGCSWSSSGLGGRDDRLQQPVLVITQRLAGPVIPNQSTICGRPHPGLPKENPRNAVTTADQTSSTRPAHPFKTGCEKWSSLRYSSRELKEDVSDVEEEAQA